MGLHPARADRHGNAAGHVTSTMRRTINPNGARNSLYNNIDYQAVLGSSFNGTGAAEQRRRHRERARLRLPHVRVRKQHFENANNVGAVFKLHNGNTKIPRPPGPACTPRLMEISDNLFSGTSGAQSSSRPRRKMGSPMSACATSSSNVISSPAADRRRATDPGLRGE